MPKLVPAPAVVQAAGTKPKRIEEYAGRVNTGHTGVSVARMVSPGGWEEPGQRPEFEEITVVLRGMLRVEHEGGALDVRAGQAVVTSAGNGSATALNRTAPSMWRFACRPFLLTRCIGNDVFPSNRHRDQLGGGNGLRAAGLARPCATGRRAMGGFGLSDSAGMTDTRSADVE
jgi:hypothetical protein